MEVAFLKCSMWRKFSVKESSQPCMGVELVRQVLALVVHCVQWGPEWPD